MFDALKRKVYLNSLLLNSLLLNSFLKSLLLLCVLSTFGISSASARIVSQEPELTSHELNCDEIFSCPEEIKRRIDFWVNVFRLWGKDNKILHDSNRPERVYMVLDSQDQCSRKKPKGEVKTALNTIQSRLTNYAKLIKNGADKQVLQTHRYYKLFPSANLKEVLDAKKSIRCQSGNKELFSQALLDYQRYKPYVFKALIAHKLPLDIQYLPFVESSYNPKAYSFAGAAGMWQIMPRTARSLGLQVGSAIDERFEPEFATLAAAKYFRKSIDKLTEVAKEGNHSTAPADLNPFVITSYNYGVRGMHRAIEQVGTDYIRLLNEYKSRSFQTAVKNFYASFLAARYVAQNKHRYFPDLPSQNDLIAIDRIAIPKPLLLKNILSVLKVSKKQFKKMNPAITNRAWRNQSAIPTGFIVKVPYKASGWDEKKNRLNTLRSNTTGRGDSGSRHKVRKGQTACGIANIHKVRCKDLIALNKLSRKAVIKIGQRLKIPGGVQRYRNTNIVRASQELRKQLNIEPIKTSFSAKTISKQNGQNIEEIGNKDSQLVSTNEFIGSILEQQKIQQLQIDQQQTERAAEVKQTEIEKTDLLRVSIDTNSKIKTIQSVDIQSQQVTNIQAVKPENGKENKQKNDLNSVVNLKTTISTSNGRYWIEVLPSESLGLYADWLSIGTTQTLRRLNNLKGKASVNVFQRVYLPITNQQQSADFVLNRNEYHLNIQLQYFERFQIVSIGRYQARPGDNMWSLAQKNNIPMWLLMQYNKSIQFGSKVDIPEVKKRFQG